MRRLVLSALAAAVSLASAAHADDLSEAKPVIEAANANWAPAMRARNAGRVAAAYAEDGVYVGPDGSVIAGRAAFEASLRGKLSSMPPVTGGSITQDGLQSIQPGLIYEWGHGALELTTPSGEKRLSGGRYLSVWRRGDDGVWRIARNLSFAF